MWTEQDFDQMGWHDNRIYGIAFGPNEHELMLDIDYILQWNQGDASAGSYSFSIVPATLVFRNVYNVRMDFATVDVDIQDIFRDNPTRPKNADYLPEKTEYGWTIETTSGEIVFRSVGFKQYARQEPKESTSQQLDFYERRGVSFDIPDLKK